jgi:hypothetical protein
MERAEVCSLKIPNALSFRSPAFSREESALAPPAASRFLAGKAGFGMKRAGMAGLTHQAAIS